MTESTPPTILLANEPLAYRQVLAGALRAGHHNVAVVAVAAEDLDAAVARYRPVLVICDDVTALLEARVPVWVLLYPDGARLVVTSVHGVHRYAPDIDLEALGELVDRAVGPDVVAHADPWSAPGGPPD